MVVRITRFTLPTDLDRELEARGYEPLDETRVMVCTRMPAGSDGKSLPPGLRWERLNATDYAEAVGALRGSPDEQRRAHAERLATSPVPYRGFVLRREADGAAMACGQFARDAELVGLYDVHTRADQRGKGLAALLCERLLSLSMAEGAAIAYLQVEADNHGARRLYQRLGFADQYSYHYRQPPPGA